MRCAQRAQNQKQGCGISSTTAGLRFSKSLVLQIARSFLPLLLIDFLCNSFRRELLNCTINPLICPSLLSCTNAYALCVANGCPTKSVRCYSWRKLIFAHDNWNLPCLVKNVGVANRSLVSSTRRCLCVFAGGFWNVQKSFSMPFWFLEIHMGIPSKFPRQVRNFVPQSLLWIFSTVLILQHTCMVSFDILSSAVSNAALLSDSLRKV